MLTLLLCRSITPIIINLFTEINILFTHIIDITAFEWIVSPGKKKI